LYAAVLEGNDFPVGHGEDPPDGAGKPHGGVVPEHVLGEDEFPDERGEKFREDVKSFAPGFGDFGAGIAYAVNLGGDEPVYGDSLAFCESLGCAGRISVGVECRGPGRPLEGADEVFLEVFRVPHREGYTPGGGKGGKAFEGYAGSGKIVPGRLLEGIEDVGQKA